MVFSSSARAWAGNVLYTCFVFGRTLSAFYVFTKYGLFLSRVRWR